MGYRVRTRGNQWVILNDDGLVAGIFLNKDIEVQYDSCKENKEK